jgi:hypothetical protein
MTHGKPFTAKGRGAVLRSAVNIWLCYKNTAHSAAAGRSNRKVNVQDMISKGVPNTRYGQVNHTTRATTATKLSKLERQIVNT